MKKTVKVLTTAALLASLAAPFAAPVSAATDNVALTVPTVSANASAAAPASLGVARVTETEATMGSVDAGQQITVTLPQGVEYLAPPTAGTLADFVSVDGSALVMGDVSLVAGSATTKGFTLSIDSRTSTASKAAISFKFDSNNSRVTLDGVSGAIKVNVYAPNSGVTSGDIVVGQAQNAGGSAVALNAPTISRAAAQTLGTIRVSENRGGAFDTTNYIDFVLPKGFTFTNATVTAVNTTVGDADTATVGQQNFIIGTDANGYSRLRVKPGTVTAVGSTPGFLNVTPVITVDSDADLGDLTVNVKGDNTGITATSVVAAKVAEYGVTAAVEGDAPTVYVGRQDQDLAKMSIKEGIAGSLLSNRTIVLELPEWAHWQGMPTEDGSVKKGDATITASGSTVDNDRRKLSLNVTGGAVKTETVLKDLNVFLDANAPEGDLKVKVSGSQGLTGEFTLAKVKKPVSVSADLKDVKIGVQSQVAGDITIKEDAAGTLKATVTELSNGWTKNGVVTNTNQNGQIVLDAPTGVTFASVPKVEVTEGDLKLVATGVKLNSNKDQLIIPVDTASKKASTIKVSDVKFTLDRTVPEGKLTLDLTGNALDQTRDSNNATLDAVVKADVANVVTPAPNDTTASNIVFKLNSKTFTIDGKETTMDAAPLVAWDRAFLPIRFAANALNVSDDNIIWDDKTSTATIFKGDRVIVAKVGDKFMTVNGAKVPMDVPVYRSAATNNRVMIPVRYLANALGANIQWNQATNEITIEAQK